jgi:uncharacterized protein (DUF2236 family)
LHCDERTLEVVRILRHAPSPSALARPFGALMMRAGFDLLPQWGADMLGVDAHPLMRRLVRVGVDNSAPVLRWAVRNGSAQRAKRRVGAPEAR